MTEQPQNPFGFGRRKDPDWFKKLTEGLQPPAQPTPPTDADWDSLFTSGASQDAPAELPSRQRVAIAQMYAQYAELQRVGFSEDRAYQLVLAQVVTAVQVAGEIRFRREQGGS